MSPVKIRIDADLCKRDGLCATVCPSRIFSWARGQVPEIVDPETCCLCGQCLAVCPGGAIDHSALDQGAFEAIDRGALRELQGGHDLVAWLRQRRSVRAYRKREVPRELLAEVVRSAGFAPTGAFGGEGWVRQVTVVSDPKIMAEVVKLTATYMESLLGVLDGVMVRTAAHFSEEARAGRTTIPDLKMRLQRWSRGINDITYGAPVALFVHAPHSTTTPQQDCDAALMNIMLSAHATGLGTCWNGWLGHAATGAHVRGFTALRDLLELPEGPRVVEAATLGWPRVHLHSLPHRETAVRWL